MKKFVLASAVGLLLTGCAGRGCQLCTAPSKPVGFDVKASEKDHAVTMHAGQKLEVVLRADSGMANWAHPKSSDTSILAPTVDPGAAGAIGVTLGAFAAIKPGQADVTSYAAPKCSPGEACPMYVAAYSLKVTVTQ